MYDLIQNNSALSLLLGGLVIGFGFGALIQRTGFCVMGSLSDAAGFGDTRRLRAWMLAIAIALIGTHLLEAYASLDLSQSRYLGPRLNWLGHAAGGFVFGIGMVLAGGCASRNLVRAGSGDLRSLMVVLVIGVSAYATISGVMGYARASLANATAVSMQSMDLPSQHLGDIIATLSFADPKTIRITVVSSIAVGLVLFALSDRAFRASPRHIISGIGVGLAVVAGWALTTLAHDAFADRPTIIQSLSFIAPIGAALDWFQRATAIGLPGFAASSVIGTLIGGFAAAQLSRSFALQTFHDVSDTVRHLIGAVLMGVGGVFALGCTIGQGVSGLATLSLGSIISVAAIVLGGIVTIRVLMR